MHYYFLTVKYILDNKLLNIFNLELGKSAINAINAQGYLSDFLKVEQTALKLKDRLAEQAQKADLSVEGLILSSQRLEVMQQLC